MNADQAILEVCRRFCSVAGDAHDDACVALREALTSANHSERIPLARLKESNPARWRDMCECGHTVHEHSASNGCWWCECDVDA